MLYTSFQEVRYHADGKTRTSLSVVSKVRRHLLPPGESDFYDDLPLLIRAVPPSLKFCHIMDLEYILEVSSLRKNYSECSATFTHVSFLWFGKVNVNEIMYLRHPGRHVAIDS